MGIDQDLARVMGLLRNTGAFEYAMQKAREYSDRGKKALSVLPESEARATLCQLADFTVVRER